MGNWQQNRTVYKIERNYVAIISASDTLSVRFSKIRKFRASAFRIFFFLHFKVDSVIT